VTGNELVLEVLALVIGIALVLATGLALLAAAAAGLLNDRTERRVGSYADRNVRPSEASWDRIVPAWLVGRRAVVVSRLVSNPNHIVRSDPGYPDHDRSITRS
jgi:hypothetical protein